MEILRHLLPDSASLQLKSWLLDEAKTHIKLSVSSTQPVVHCPICAHSTHRIHSRYERTLADLPDEKLGHFGPAVRTTIHDAPQIPNTTAPTKMSGFIVTRGQITALLLNFRYASFSALMQGVNGASSQRE